MTVLTRIGPSESQSRADYPDRRPTYRGLREAIRWFRDEYQASLTWRLHEGFSSIGDDALGGPAWTPRFEAYICEPSRDPLRITLADMARGSLFERVGARFLFVLTCQDFDPRAAGLAMTPPLMPEYVAWYAEKAIDRLREKMTRLPERTKPSGARQVQRPEWMEGVW